MKKRPTILQVLPWLDSGGVERGTVDIAQSIIEAGGTALVAAERGRLAGQLEAMGGRLLEFDGRSKNPVKILVSHVSQLERMIRDNDVDLVHARSRAPAWSAYLAARRAGVPFVTTYHGAYSQKGRLKAFYNSVMAKGDIVIANSDYTARLVEERNPDAKGRITSVYRGVDLARFDITAVTETRRQALHNVWELDMRPCIILPSRLTRWKGQSFILPVMAALKAQGQVFQLVLIGDDQGREAYVAELDDLISRFDLADCVRRAGHCADMPAAYALADLVIVPSQDAETFGRSAAEAQAMGKPVIVGDLGAQPEVTAALPDCPESERTGWIVPHANTEAWQQAMTMALGLDEAEKAAMAARARARVERYFSLEAMGQQTLAVYDKMLGTSLSKSVDGQ